MTIILWNIHFLSLEKVLYSSIHTIKINLNQFNTMTGICSNNFKRTNMVNKATLKYPSPSNVCTGENQSYVVYFADRKFGVTFG